MKYFIFSVSLLIMSFSGHVLANNPGPSSREDYVQFLKLKKQTLLDNIRNADKTGFMPKDVLWLKGEGAKVVPRPNPHRQEFNPVNPLANESGMILYPNVDKEKELANLRSVQKELDSLNIQKQ